MGRSEGKCQDQNPQERGKEEVVSSPKEAQLRRERNTKKNDDFYNPIPFRCLVHDCAEPRSGNKQEARSRVLETFMICSRFFSVTDDDVGDAPINEPGGVQKEKEKHL